jgi:selenide,water dikinase
LARLTPQSSPVLLQGIGDDAAIIQWSQAKVVTSCDGFRAMIDDPYRFGRIAAHHALNDLFAMGAAPSYALAIVTVPLMADALMEEDLFQVMSGAIEVLNEHGAVLAGGHSGEGAELTIGFAVTGGLTMNALSKGGLIAGQGLILTKAIGTGAILAGAMQGKTRADDLMATIDAMDTSNGRAADILRDHGATACTDVTGFGLIGHLGEMLRASSMGVRLNAADVPKLPSAQELLAAGVQSSLQTNNEQALLDFEIRGGSPASPSVRLLADPQTAGGLLAGVPADACDDCVEALRAGGYADAVVIGSVQAEARVVEGA